MGFFSDVRSALRNSQVVAEKCHLLPPEEITEPEEMHHDWRSERSFGIFLIRPLRERLGSWGKKITFSPLIVRITESFGKIQVGKHLQDQV